MKKRTRAVSLSLALAIAVSAVIPWTFASTSDSASGSISDSGSNRTASWKAAQGDMLSVSQSGQSLQTFALGPGLVNLSPADQFATYQWGLKNDGEFQLVEIKAKFQAADNIYSGGKGGFGLPGLGPGDFESTVTDAVTGVDINIRPAWDLYDQSENKRSVVVAIIDTGVDYNHQEFSGAMWTNPGEIPGDGIDNDGNGYVDDVHGWNFYSGNSQIFVGEEDSHGTHAAGTIAASRNNGGSVGITDNQYVKIMSIKALGGEEGKGSPESVIAAIRYAEANGAQICNLSFGSENCTEEFRAAIQGSKMLFVVAAGNGNEDEIGYNIDQNPVYPASLPYDNIITVANLIFNGKLDRSSNFGPASVDIAAPGTFILSTIPDKSYAFMSGTSMAAPMVAGAAAMLYSARPELSLQDVRNILITSAHKLDTLNGRVYSGGMLDVYSALQWARQ